MQNSPVTFEKMQLLGKKGNVFGRFRAFSDDFRAALRGDFASTFAGVRQEPKTYSLFPPFHVKSIS